MNVRKASSATGGFEPFTQAPAKPAAEAAPTGRVIAMAALAVAAALMALAALARPTAALAQDARGGVQDLDAISVTATRTTRDLSEVPLSVSVVGSEAIADDPRTEPSEYLKDVPGVQVGRNSYSQWLFSIRGQGSERTMILIDGVPQRFASTLLSEASGSLSIDPWEIDRIEIVKGPASALYGSDAIGGVVSVVTRKGGDQPFGMAAGLTWDGSADGWAPRAALYGDLGGFWWRVSAAALKTGETRLPDSDRLHHSGTSQRFLSTRLGYSWEGGEVDLSLSGFSGRRDLPALITSLLRQFNPVAVRLPSGDRYSSIPDERRSSAAASLTLFDPLPLVRRIRLAGFLLEERTDMIFFFNTPDASDPFNKLNPAGLSRVDGRDRARNLGASLVADLALGQSHLLTLGADVQRSEAESAGAYSGVYALTTKNEDRGGRTESLAVFVQDEWRVLDDLTLTAGLRWTRTENSLTKDAAYPSRTGSGSEGNLVGSAGLVWRPVENLSLRALYSQGFRAPTLSATMGQTQRYLPNPDLKAETSDNFELGARWSDGGLNLDLAVFYSQLDNPFYDASTDRPHPAGRTYVIVANAVSAKSLGAELFASYEFASIGLTPYVSFTAMSYEREAAGGKSTRNTGVPENWGTGGLKFSRDVSGSLRFFSDLALTWSAGYVNTTWANIVSATPATSLEYRPGFKIDLTLGVEGLASGKWRAVLGLKNIGDRSFEPWGYHQPGFHVVGSLSYEL